MIEFEKTIRGVEVTVYADNFYSDHSVGIEFGPDEVYATKDNGEDFELTEQEIVDLSGEAIDLYWEKAGY